MVGPETVLLGMLFGAIHPGIATATAKSVDTVVRAAKSDQSRVHKLALAGPARMAKSQAKIVMVLYPRQRGLHRGLDGCFWRVKYSQTRPAGDRLSSHGLRQPTPLMANRRPEWKGFRGRLPPPDNPCVWHRLKRGELGRWSKGIWAGRGVKWGVCLISVAAGVL